MASAAEYERRAQMAETQLAELEATVGRLEEVISQEAGISLPQLMAHLQQEPVSTTTNDEDHTVALAAAEARASAAEEQLAAANYRIQHLKQSLCLADDKIDMLEYRVMHLTRSLDAEDGGNVAVNTIPVPNVAETPLTHHGDAPSAVASAPVADASTASASPGPAQTTPVADGAGKGKEEDAAQGQGKKAAAQPKKAAAKPQPGARDVFSRLNVLVGRIVEVKPHPESEKLYIERIDLGEAEPRTILSGLQPYLTVGQMMNKLVLVVANMKPKPLAGIPSNGMVLTAEKGDTVELLQLPESCQPGDRAVVEGIEGEPDTQLNPRKKFTAKALKKMITNEALEVLYDGQRLTIGNEPVRAATLKGATIH